MIVINLIILLNINQICAYLNIDELSNYQYDVDILNIPKHSADYMLENDNIVLLSSKFGQKYQCSIDQPKNDIKTEPQTVEKSIIELLQPIEEGPCLQYSNGWWTYELCYKKFIRQFHQSDDKAIVGDIIYLGYYNSEFDWNNTQQKENVKFYHSQNYINGTLCDITKEQRSAEVRVKCRDDTSEMNGGDVITVVEEPLTCRYVITVETPRLCAHPQMRYKVEKDKFGIRCSPLLDTHHYQEYLQENTKSNGEDSINDDDDEYEDTEDDSNENIDAGKIKEDEINMLTKIMVKIGNNIGTKLNKKNNAEVKSENIDKNSKFEMKEHATEQLDENLEADQSEKSDDDKSLNYQNSVSDGNINTKPHEENIADITSLNIDRDAKNEELDKTRQVAIDEGTDAKINSQRMDENGGLMFIAEGESIRQEMEDILDLDFENVITQSINEILHENNEFIKNENTKSDDNFNFKSEGNLNDQTKFNKKSEEITHDLNFKKDNDKILKDDNIDIAINNQDDMPKLDKNVQKMDFLDHLEVEIDDETRIDNTEKKHFSYDDLKDGKIKWEAGNHQNQEIFISSKSSKRKKKKVPTATLR